MENFTENNSLSYWDITQLSTENLRYSLVWTISFTLAYTLIFVLGFIGNFAVILVVYRKLEMRTVTNLFIFNLALADLLVIVFCVPVTLATNIFTPWLFGSVICKAVSYAQGASVFTSVYSLIAISVDRCSALYWVNETPHGFTIRQAKKTCIFIWALGLLITCPWLIFFNVEYSPDNDQHMYPVCVENWDNSKFLQNAYFVGVHVILCFVFPVLVLTTTNSILFWNFRNYRHMQMRSCHRMIQFDLLAATKQLVLVTVMFVGSWLPLYGLMIKRKIYTNSDGDKDDDEWEYMEYFVALAQLLGSSNSCVNPMLYAYHNKRFMRKLRSFCCTKKWRRRRRLRR